MPLSKSKIARLALFAAMLAIAACTRKDSRDSVPELQGGFPPVGAPSVPRQAEPSPVLVRTDRLDGAKSTRDILTALSKDCLACAEKNDCLKPERGGGLCEQMSGKSKVSGKDEKELCLEALRCIFTSKCANTGEETPCLCGATDVLQCMKGEAPPRGACVTEFKNDFGDNGKLMYDEFINQGYGAGRANALVQCVVPLCPTCRFP
jgi:hypothetical protein